MTDRAAYLALPKWARMMYIEARKRSKKRGHSFDLTEGGLVAIYADRCALTGIKFDHAPPDGVRRPFAPSLDRPDSARGYANDNARFVCVAVNLAMNQWGEEVLFRIATNLVAKQGDRKKFRLGDDELPDGIRARMSLKGIRYAARVGRGDDRVQVGTFKTLDEAVAAMHSFPLDFP